MVDLLDDVLDLQDETRTDERELRALARAPAPRPGMCALCDHRAQLTCSGCGKEVCKADSWVMFGLCRVCATEDRVARWNKQKEVDSQNWLEDA